MFTFRRAIPLISRVSLCLKLQRTINSNCNFSRQVRLYSNSPLSSGYLFRRCGSLTKRRVSSLMNQHYKLSNRLALKLFSTNSEITNSSKPSASEKYPIRVSIGSVFKDVEKPKTPPFVPILYYNPSIHTQTELGHLQWMLKKDLLGQDMFLIGPPGPFRRRLTMAFAELTCREVEYISLSRDTTESDMKQRREVMKKTAQYLDQSAVRAAIEGRLLVVEGIEKAERNVLPLLNNLLENREMHLEDGRHLISPERYDKLLLEHGPDVLNKWKLVKVNENFRVIALGLPVPFFKGNPLDPPLRSRFQGRSIVPLTATVVDRRTMGKNYRHLRMSWTQLSIQFTYSIIHQLLIYEERFMSL